ncbi:MAG: carbohydrate-binding domain-containing protein [Bacteroidaceae bacterium]|nr:carbohydrate-binding domain-containing protein [Bacteroidaceae bacterium]
MKRLFTIITIMALVCSESLHAQNAYVCHGYSYDTYAIADIGDMQFSANKDTVEICGETYEVADIDSITFSEPQFPTISIVYSGNSATVTIPSSITGVTCTSGTSSHVVLTSTNTTTEYLYTASGSSTNGSLTINGSYKMSLMLAGLTLTSGTGAAIDIECGKRIDIILKEGTTNTLADYAGGDQKGALYAKGHIELKGAGTLNVTGNCKHAICAKEYFIVKASVGTVNILAAKNDGIHCGRGEKGSEHNYFQMNGGTLNISGCGSDCIDSDDYGCVNIKGGTLKLDVSGTDAAGILCDSIYKQSGGDITFTAGGQESKGIHASYSATFKGGTVKGTVSGAGARGIRGKKVIKLTGTVKNGGALLFTGTDVELTVSGEYYSTTQCVGILTDTTLEQTGGDLTITVTNSKAADIVATTRDTWTGGTRNGVSKAQ